MSKDVFRLHAERDVCKWSTDTHKDATPVMEVTSKLGMLVLQKPTPMATDEDGTE